jgi:nucleotide-binding universal stress UspA family protein
MKTTLSTYRSNPFRQVPVAAPTLDAKNRRVRPARILVGVDFSAESAKAVKYAAALARRFGSALVLAHVIEPVPYPSDFGYGPMMLDFPGKDAVRRIRLRLAALVKKHAGSGVPVETEILNGAIYNELAKAAGALHIDLIVIGTHGYTGLDHALMGSAAEKVVRHAPCPVLVVRKRQREIVHPARPD